jgi:hypothetical protein
MYSYLPREIVIEIVSYLNAKDLGSFRLAHRELAEAGVSLIAQNGISILNTHTCIEGLPELSQNDMIAKTIKKLTLYHGVWLYYTSQECTHQYFQFISEEQSCKHNEEVDIVAETLNSLTNLNTIVVSWIPPKSQKYHDLQKRISSSLYIQDDVTLVVRMLLLVLSTCWGSTTRNLRIHRTLSPEYVFTDSLKLNLSKIEDLYIKSFRVLGNQDSIKGFLQAFPNLIHLSVGFCGLDERTYLVGDQFWPYLKTPQLCDVQSHEDDLLGIFERHYYRTKDTLQSLILSNATLVDGSWNSFFTRIYMLDAQLIIKELGGLRPEVMHRLEIYHSVST